MEKKEKKGFISRRIDWIKNKFNAGIDWFKSLNTVGKVLLGGLTLGTGVLTVLFPFHTLFLALYVLLFICLFQFYYFVFDSIYYCDSLKEVWDDFKACSVTQKVVITLGLLLAITANVVDPSGLIALFFCTAFVIVLRLATRSKVFVKSSVPVNA
jgi:uncharacterized membrane protein YbaN (DUF454 family)